MCSLGAPRPTRFLARFLYANGTRFAGKRLVFLRRRLHGRVRLTNHDRWFFYPAVSLGSVDPAGSHDCPARDARALAQSWLSLLLALGVAAVGRATTDRHGVANWGAPRIHGEMLKLVLDGGGPPSQGWRTCLPNNAADIAAMDWFVVPTIGFDLLYGLVIARLDRRDLVWIKSWQTRRQNGLHVRSRWRFLGMRLRTTSSAIGSMVASSRADCAVWASGTSLPHEPLPGIMALPNG
jgi:hypothetical protein